MITLAANIELLFTEAGDQPAERIRAAAQFGFTEVECWTWRDKDLLALEQALVETGLILRTLIVDPQLDLTDPATHADYLRAVHDSVPVAEQLGSPFLVVVAGNDHPDIPRTDQRAAVVSVLREAVQLVPESITLLLENLNDRVDHPGTFLTSVAEGLEMITEIGSPRLKMLLDAYHALAMGEDVIAAVDGRMDLIGHIQIADLPGRHEPGTGTVNWTALLQTLVDAGYCGSFGLEYLPASETTASLQHIVTVAVDIT